MKQGSLFTGIGGFDLGFQRAGFELAWEAEIEPFPNRVLEARFPGVPNYGDVTKIDGRTLSGVDVLTFGSPCQDLSVAGKRAGLDGSRSSLFYEASRIIEQCAPTFAIWENVPGAFSSNTGRDFLAVLDTLAQLGPVDVAWRVFDSQYSGVPQQRRRVYLVADFGGRRAASVLFDAESCEGHSSPRGETRENAPAAPRGRSSRDGVNTPGRGGEDDDNLVAPALQASGPPGTRRDDEVDLVVSPSMTSQWAKGSGGPAGDEVQNLIASTMTTSEGGGRSRFQDDNLVSHSLTAEGADASEDGTGRGTPLTVIQNVIGVRDKKQNGIGVRSDDTSYTLDLRSQHAVEIPSVFVQNQRDEVREMAQAGAVVSEPGAHMTQYVRRSTIRRFTPTECERLQGFPDGWTCLCGSGGDMFACKCPDGPRYRALGNAVTVNVAEWIARRIAALL